MKKNQTILIVDSSGRGAALADAYGKSRFVKRIIAVPGNDLMQAVTKKKVKTYPDVATTEVEKIVNICKKEKITFVDVAQDDGVAAGISDAVEKLGIPYIGPTKSAGQIEWDKAWSRDFMARHKLPIPKFYVFHSEQEGIKFLKTAKDQAWFVKASGLAGGKGALPAINNTEAVVRIKELQKFGTAGKTYVLEQWLVGEEFSAFAIADGKSIQMMGFAQDHKRMYNFDLGENTGGMGCSTPPLVVTPKIKKQAEDIIKKTIEGLAKEGRIFTGVLYLGGIVVNGNVYIIEFNARWGSPEAEVLVPRVKTDMLKIGLAVSEKKLSKLKITCDKKARVVVTGALKPGENAKQGRRKLFGLEKVLKLPGIKVYGARTFKAKNGYEVSEGRLFQLVAEGKDVIEARKKAYEAMSLLYIEGNNLHYRTDIGFRDVERLVKK